jgi:ketosteroid isomerase-like protein
MPVTKLTPEQKIARVKTAYTKLSRGEISGAIDGFAEDATWDGFVVGKVHGRQQIKEGLGKLTSLSPQFDLHDVLANDDHVVALQTVTVKKDGKTFETRQVIVAHVDEDGKLKEVWTIGNPQDLAPVLGSR